jgi:Cu/Ag efflux protein CusF
VLKAPEGWRTPKPGGISNSSRKGKLNALRIGVRIIPVMRTTALRTWTVVGVSVLTATAAVRSLADQAMTATKPEKSYTGTVVSVNPQEHVLKVKGFWLFSKSFNLGDTCSYTFLDNRLGTTSDLHPGQKVTVSYQNVDGVLVANRVGQKPMSHEGTVKAIDPAAHTLTVHARGLNKTFQLADDCRVALRNNRSGTLADVQPGNRVTVIYETPNGKATARQIAQTSATFTGVVTAIDLGDRTVKAKALSGTTKFHLAGNCAILVNGKTDAELRELKPGDKLVFSYDEVNGVNVVNRIADAETPAKTVMSPPKR